MLLLTLLYPKCYCDKNHSISDHDTPLYFLLYWRTVWGETVEVSIMSSEGLFPIYFETIVVNLDAKKMWKRILEGFKSEFEILVELHFRCVPNILDFLQLPCNIQINKFSPFSQARLRCSKCPSMLPW